MRSRGGGRRERGRGQREREGGGVGGAEKESKDVGRICVQCCYEGPRGRRRSRRRGE
jgi:hypothetical protein